MSKPTRGGRAYTLLELVAASGGAAIVLAGTVAAMSAGVRAIDSTSIAPARDRAAAETGFAILTDSRTALEVETTVPTRVDVTLQPISRDADAERVEYDWSGELGTPLKVRVGTLRGLLANRDELTEADVTSLENTGTIDAQETPRLTTHLRRGLSEFDVSTGGSTTPTGYANHHTTRFVFNLTISGTGVGIAATNTVPYNRIIVSVREKDDRYMTPAVVGATLPAGLEARSVTMRTLDYLFETTVYEPATISLALDVTSDWALDYSVWEVDEDEDNGDTQLLASGSIHGEDATFLFVDAGGGILPELTNLLNPFNLLGGNN